MDELVKLVQKKTGLNRDQAVQAVEIVIGFLEERLPKPVAEQLDRLLTDERAMDTAGELLDKGLDVLSDVLGKKGS